MKHQTVDLTRELFEKMEGQCLNCGGILEQNNERTLTCCQCHFKYVVETRNYQIFYWLLMVSFLSFVGGALLVMAITLSVVF